MSNIEKMKTEYINKLENSTLEGSTDETTLVRCLLKSQQDNKEFDNRPFAYLELIRERLVPWGYDTLVGYNDPQGERIYILGHAGKEFFK